jgi:hypothetical protein
MGMPLGVYLPLTTQLLLPSMSCSSGMRRAACSFGTNGRYGSTMSGEGRTPGANGLPSPLRAAASSSSVNQFRSSPSGTTRSSQGSGAARRLASATPRRFAFSASWISLIPCPRTLSIPSCAHRSVTVRAVHGSGLIPVSLNSTGRLSAFWATYAFRPLAHAVKSRSASRW